MFINRFFKCLAFVVLSETVASTISAQNYTPTKEDYKAAKKEAKALAKEGWKVSPGDLSLVEQIALSKPVLRDGDNWIVGQATSKGTVFDAVQSNAMFQASFNISKIVDAKIAGDGKGGTGNNQGSTSASYTTYAEIAKNKYNNEIKHPKSLMRCYRTLPDGTIEVQSRLAIRWNEQEIIKEVKKKLNQD